MHCSRGLDAAPTAGSRRPRSRARALGRAALRLGTSAAALLPLLVQADPAQADDDLWLVTRVELGAARAEELEAAARLGPLLRARGLEVLDAASAAAEFERKHSRHATRLPPAEINELDAALRTLADDLASENLGAAEQALADIEALSPDIRDQLNHDQQRARRRFHICLLAAHLFSKEGYAVEASGQVRKCARDFPGLAPEQGPYLPDSIRTFFARADRELESIARASLHVELESADTDACRVRVNGIDRGPTPASMDDLRT